MIYKTCLDIRLPRFPLFFKNTLKTEHTHIHRWKNMECVEPRHGSASHDKLPNPRVAGGHLFNK